jgi:hypothetical protein
MKRAIRISIITGGVLNLLLALFHVVLCYQIYLIYGNQPIYPLLQMPAIGGMLFIFLPAYTSLFCPSDMISTGTGQLIILFNVILCLVRTAGEFILCPKPRAWIIAVCLIPAVLYSFVFIGSRKK